MAELTVDNGFKHIRVVRGFERQYSPAVVIADQEIIEEVTINFGCTNGTAPGFGATYSPTCTVTINSNEITDSEEYPNLDYIRLGEVIHIACDRQMTYNYETMGTFVITQPPIFTDDYKIEFTADGLLGSIFANTKMDFSLMEQYSAKGIITIEEALEIFETQFGVTTNLPDTSELPSNVLSVAKIVVPMKQGAKKNWNKWSYKKKFAKISARNWLAGIAVMLGCNVVEYSNEINFVSFAANYYRELPSGNAYYDDSFSNGYEVENRTYAPKSMYLDTYATKPLKLKGESTIRGYAYDGDCSCNNVYTSPVGADTTYNVNIDCQWIGRSFEYFYFNYSGVMKDTDSGNYDDATPYRTYPSRGYAYTPSSWDFSGDDPICFTPGNFIHCCVRKSDGYYYYLVFIMEMVWRWNGNINVQISSTFNGDIDYKSSSASATRSVKSLNTKGDKEATRDVSTPSFSIGKKIKIQIGDKVDEVRNAANDGVIDEDRIEGDIGVNNGFRTFANIVDEKPIPIFPQINDIYMDYPIVPEFFSRNVLQYTGTVSSSETSTSVYAKYVNSFTVNAGQTMKTTPSMYINGDIQPYIEVFDRECWVCYCVIHWDQIQDNVAVVDIVLDQKYTLTITKAS